MNRNLTVKVEKEIEPTTLKTNISSSILQRKPIFCFLLFYRWMEAQIVFIFIKKNPSDTIRKYTNFNLHYGWKLEDLRLTYLMKSYLK